MAFELPTSLSPSKVSAFQDCALAFRFSAIDRLPEPPSAPAVKGTLVHRALELLFCEPAHRRSVERAQECLVDAMAELGMNPEFTGLGLDDTAAESFFADASKMLDRYFLLEDPAAVSPIGIELRLQVEVGDLRLRGIIDRLELDAEGELVVTDYKTGRAPTEQQERARLGGVHFYAFMCEQLLGRRPARVQLMYLGQKPQMIIATPTEQSTRGLERKVLAIWDAITRACERENFQPKPSRLCDWCAFQAFCPAVGGDLSLVPAVSVELERTSTSMTFASTG
ncbi:MAG: PD-(D/E)XK nuclease family protein [Microthrixaceae bacterium]|nr:PD-(D/E)XK nuclease family protein [Microthrixaceae bacterium]